MERPFRILTLIAILVVVTPACQPSPVLITENPNSITMATEIKGLESKTVTALETQQTNEILKSSITPASSPLTATDLIIPTLVDAICYQDKLVQLYDKASPGVVALRVLNRNEVTLGSGFVFDKEGHIITNYHVVENEANLEVAFPSGKKYRGWVAGVDEYSDLAVIRVEVREDELYPLPLGKATQIKIGQFVVALGNPFGLEGTMTVGIVSGKGRTLTSQRTGAQGSFFTAGDIIQTDAAVNPGNSGGPLLNLDGEVIGVNESILTSGYKQVSSGVAFAISVDIVRRIVPELINKGEFKYPYLGIFSLEEITLLTQEVLGLPRATGVYVTDVAPGSPADRAGIQAGSKITNLPGVAVGGDLIIAIDGYEVLSFNDLMVFLTLNKNPGDYVVLTILRGDEKIDLKLLLDERPK